MCEGSDHVGQADLPSHARVVIVGGGIMGVGLAYHLGHEGWGAEVVLLEKAELTSGSTWHAAGQITHSTSSFSLGKCVDYNIGLYSGALEAETGQAVTWHGCGSFRLAYTEDEMDWLRHTLSVGARLGSTSSWWGRIGWRSCTRSTTSTACWALCTRPTTAMSTRPT
jgi:dimethylglycine dehydrogenase